MGNAKIQVRQIDTFGSVNDDNEKTGHLHIKGNCVMRGYFKDPKSTSKAIDKDGWLKTGDIASI